MSRPRPRLVQGGTRRLSVALWYREGEGGDGVAGSTKASWTRIYDDIVCSINMLKK